MDLDGEYVNKVFKEKMGVIYGIGKQSHATNVKVFHVMPFLKLKSNKGDPTRLGFRINPPFKVM